VALLLLAAFALGAYLIWTGREFTGAGVILAALIAVVEFDLLV
jgi:hypothetical protein